MADAYPYLILVIAGFVAGVLNVLAGGGSFITLPILIFLGLPSTIANGTNRVGVLTQNVMAIWGFHRFGVLEWRWALTASVPAVAGAAVGTWAAFQISDEGFRRVLAAAMVIMTLGTLLAPEPKPPAETRSARSWVVVLGFLLVGIYGGFLQAGVGLLVLAITSWSGMDLVRGNAVKVLAVFLLTLLAVAIFAAGSSIDWPMGLALGLGNLAGGEVGVRLAVLKGHRWLQGVVTVVVIAMAVRLWFW